jgi:DNA-binding IclR family transcriptional regulator
MLRILDLVETQAHASTPDEMAAQLGFTRSTLYRYLKELTEAGLLTSLPDLGYTLGPRIAELDFRMRTTDPLILAGAPVMADLVRAEGGVALLCRRYRDRVLCVHQEQVGDAVHSSYERGYARPLLRGAASRVILANLPPVAVSRLFERLPLEFAAAGLGSSLAAARARLRAIRQAGWDSTEGQVTPGVTGIAAPLFDGQGTVLGSLSLTLGRRALAESETRRIASLITEGAAAVGAAIGGHSQSQMAGLDRKAG